MGSNGFSFAGGATSAPLAYGPEPGTAVASLLAIDEIDGVNAPQHSAWISPLGGRGTIESDGNASGLDWAAGGLSAGFEGSGRIGAGEANFGVGLGYPLGGCRPSGGGAHRGAS